MSFTPLPGAGHPALPVPTARYIDYPAGRSLLADGHTQARLPLWRGEPVDELWVDLGGGLGDRVRTFPLALAAYRLGLAKRLRWIGVESTREIAPVVEDRPGGTSKAILPAVHTMLGILAGATVPRQSMLATVAASLGIPLEAMAGPCVRVEASPRTGAIAVQVDPPATTPAAMAKQPDMADVAGALVGLGHHVVLVGKGWAPAPAHLDLRGASLSATASVLASVSLTIAPDSGPAHLSAVLGTPTLAIFGPSDPAVHVVAQAMVPWTSGRCALSPCAAGSVLGAPSVLPCQAGHFAACVREVDAEEIIETAMWIRRCA